MRLHAVSHLTAQNLSVMWMLARASICCSRRLVRPVLRTQCEQSCSECWEAGPWWNLHLPSVGCALLNEGVANSQGSTDSLLLCPRGCGVLEAPCGWSRALGAAPPPCQHLTFLVGFQPPGVSWSNFAGDFSMCMTVDLSWSPLCRNICFRLLLVF